MTEDEMIYYAKKCIKALHLTEIGNIPGVIPCVLVLREGREEIVEYNPILNNDQAMELLLKFRFWIDGTRDLRRWSVGGQGVNTYADSLNEGIVKQVCTLLDRDLIS